MNWWENTQAYGQSADDYFARQRAEEVAEGFREAARQHVKSRASASPESQQVQVTPREEAWWICKRASCQGWMVRIVGGQRIEWVKDGKVLAGSLSGNLQVAFIESCRYLARFLEGSEL